MFASIHLAAEWLHVSLQNQQRDETFELTDLELLITEHLMTALTEKLSPEILDELEDTDDTVYIEAYLSHHLPSYQTDLETITHELFHRILLEYVEEQLPQPT